MKHTRKEDFIPARNRAVLKTGEVVKMLRELKGWTQEDLAKSNTESLGDFSHI